MAIFTLPSDAPWIDIAWNGSVYCAIENFPIGVVATSPDGEVWTVRPMVAGTWSKIIWNGTVFLVVGQSTRNTATSPDGVIWTLHVNAFPDLVGVLDVVWSGSQFCAVREGLTSAVALSVDGITWSSAYPLPIAGSSVAWDGSSFCVTMTYGSSVATSTDGVTWATHALPDAVILRDIVGGAFGLLAVGSNAAETEAAVAVSEDSGVNWVLHAVPAASRFMSVAQSNSSFFAVGDDPSYSALAAISPDGVTWELDNTVPASDWVATIFDGVKFCALGQIQVPSYSQIFATFASEYVAPMFWTNFRGLSEVVA